MSDVMLCPHCGAENDAFTPVTDPDSYPEEGDVSLCFSCAELAIFTGHGLEVRLPSDAELAELNADKRITTAQTTIRAAK